MKTVRQCLKQRNSRIESDASHHVENHTPQTKLEACTKAVQLAQTQKRCTVRLRRKRQEKRFAGIGKKVRRFSRRHSANPGRPRTETGGHPPRPRPARARVRIGLPGLRRGTRQEQMPAQAEAREAAPHLATMRNGRMGYRVGAEAVTMQPNANCPIRKRAYNLSQA